MSDFHLSSPCQSFYFIIYFCKDRNNRNDSLTSCQKEVANMATQRVQRVPLQSAILNPRNKLCVSPFSVADPVYRHTLGDVAWARLKPEVRQRFSVRPAAEQCVRYAGVMERVELSWMGWLFAQVCRLIGTPLAPFRGTNVRMRIELVPDKELNGVAWHRIYHFGPGRIFTVRSTKSKGSNGELIEHIGCGFSMRLKLSERGGDLVFTSTAYQFSIAARTFRIPALLTPGITTVTHEQIEGDHFRFSLSVDHPLLGTTIFQDGEFYSDVSER
jgi:hypothetical protein